MDAPPIQREAAAVDVGSSSPAPVGEPSNQNGLPGRLKTGVEALSGYSMDNVQVHYRSSKPAAAGALAYAQGTNIYLGPGQEKHLPHEAWHVVQQLQGRVKPTARLDKGLQVNDDAGLEREATVMGERAMRTQATHSGALHKAGGTGGAGVPQFMLRNFARTGFNVVKSVFSGHGYAPRMAYQPWRLFGGKVRKDREPSRMAKTEYDDGSADYRDPRTDKVIRYYPTEKGRRPDFSPFSRGEFDTEELTGHPQKDHYKMLVGLQKYLERETGENLTIREVKEFLKEHELELHHSGGNRATILDKSIHSASHTGYSSDKRKESEQEAKSM